MIFAVFNPSPLTECINCSFFTVIANYHRVVSRYIASHCRHSERMRECLAPGGIPRYR